MIYTLESPKPWREDAAYIDVWTSWHEEEVVVDELYTGRTPRTVQDWRGFPLLDVEARLIGTSGKIEICDFVWGGFGDIIVSDPLLRVLQEEMITGIDTRVVTIAYAEIGTIDLMEEDPACKPPILHRLVAKGIIEGAPKEVVPPEPGWPVILDLETWTGHDFTVAWGAWLLTFVSQRFVDCLRRHNIRNYRVVPGREFTFQGRRYVAFGSEHSSPEDRSGGETGRDA